MNGVGMTAVMDTSGLSRAIPLAVSNGKRTVDEQAVTSCGWILYNAQKNTPKTELATIDSELQVAYSAPMVGKGANLRRSVNKRRQREIAVPESMGMAEMIVVSRLHNPGISKTFGKPNYNLLTGNRWALELPGTRGAAAFWAWVKQKAAQMAKGRNSSIAVLKAGYTKGIKACFESPIFQHSKKWRNANRPLREQSAINQLNTRDMMKLGDLDISGAGSGNIVVRGENNVGEKSGNSILDAKRRSALIIKSGPHLQAAIYAEQANLEGRGSELDKRMTDALIPVQAMLGNP